MIESLRQALIVLATVEGCPSSRDARVGHGSRDVIEKALERAEIRVLRNERFVASEMRRVLDHAAAGRAPEAVDVLLELGDRLEAWDRREDAVPMLDTAVRAASEIPDPERVARARLALGSLHLKACRLGEAERCLDGACVGTTSPALLERAWLALGEVFAERGQLEEARRLYERARSSALDRGKASAGVSACLALAAVERAAGDTGAALGWNDRATGLLGDRSPIRRAQALRDRVLTLLAGSDGDAAILACQQALELDPSRSGRSATLCLLGRAHLAARRPRAAEDAAGEARMIALEALDRRGLLAACRLLGEVGRFRRDVGSEGFYRAAISIAAIDGQSRERIAIFYEYARFLIAIDRPLAARSAAAEAESELERLGLSDRSLRLESVPSQRTRNVR